MNSETVDDATTTGLGRRRAPLVMAGIVLLAVVVAGVALATSDGSNSGRLAGRHMMTSQRVGRLCDDWARSNATTNDAVASTWCDQMTNAMDDRMASGHMTGPMMWGTPASMRDACVKAMAGYEDAARDPDAWCQRMVTWMQQHLGDWNDSMMGRSMMGG